jgi:hypothetical protein
MPSRPPVAAKRSPSLAGKGRPAVHFDPMAEPAPQPSKAGGPRLTCSNELNRLPEKFYFETFAKPLVCPVCLGPWREPITFAPCEHTICRTCAGFDLSQCAKCNLPGSRVYEPLPDLVAQARTVRVCCELCTWIGPEAEVSQHTCKLRQHTKAVQAVRNNPSSSRAWFMLGASLDATQTEEVNGAAVTKRDCYLHSAALDPTNAMVWGNLGVTVPPNSSVQVADEQLTRKQCLVRALSLDKSLGLVWYNLGNSMQRGMSENVNGVVVYKDTCYLRAVELQPKLSAAWYNLGLCLDRGMVVDLRGREYDAAMCFITAIINQPDFADAWLKLAVVGCDGKTFLGKRWSSKACIIEALDRNRRLGEAWIALDRMMKGDEVQMIGSRVYTKEEVSKVALRFKPSTTTGRSNARGLRVKPPEENRPRRPSPSSRSRSRSPHLSSGSSSRGPNTPQSGSRSQSGDPAKRGDGNCVVM